VLDFYLASSDADFAAEYPDETKHLGGLSLEQHRALERVLGVCKQSGIMLHHYEDAAFTPEQVRVLLVCLQSNKHLASSPAAAVAAFAALEGLVSQAASHNAGLRTFCD
jgi:hypothetical protein